MSTGRFLCTVAVSIIQESRAVLHGWLQVLVKSILCCPEPIQSKCSDSPKVYRMLLVTFPFLILFSLIQSLFSCSMGIKRTMEEEKQQDKKKLSA